MVADLIPEVERIILETRRKPIFGEDLSQHLKNYEVSAVCPQQSYGFNQKCQFFFTSSLLRDGSDLLKVRHQKCHMGSVTAIEGREGGGPGWMGG